MVNKVSYLPPLKPYLGTVPAIPYPGNWHDFDDDDDDDDDDFFSFFPFSMGCELIPLEPNRFFHSSTSAHWSIYVVRWENGT